MNISVHTFGFTKLKNDDWELDEDPKYTNNGKVLTGVRLAGMGMLSPGFHFGGYFSIRAGEFELEPDNDEAGENKLESDVKAIGLGMALKAGKLVGARIFLGFGLDLGLSILKIDEFEDEDYDGDKYIGVELFPKLALEIIAVDTGSFKLVIPIGIGLHIIPISFVTLFEGEDGYEDTKSTSTSFSPSITVGVSFGG